MSQVKIIWSSQAKQSLKSIFEFYKPKSLQGAKNVRRDLLMAPKSIEFPKQFQVDEINPKFRRIIVRDFKLLYTEANHTIHIVDIISTRRSSEILKGK